MNNRLLLKLNISTVTYKFYIFQILAHLINIMQFIVWSEYLINIKNLYLIILSKAMFFFTKLDIINILKTIYSNSISCMKLKKISYLYLIDFKLLIKIWPNKIYAVLIFETLKTF